jgi:hypothetical protein
MDTKKWERGRTWPRRQSGDSRIVSKQNASPVLSHKAQNPIKTNDHKPTNQANYQQTFAYYVNRYPTW